MAQYEPKVEQSQSTTDPVVVEFTAPLPMSSIGAAAIDSSGNPVATANVSGGTATIEVQSSVGAYYETLYQQDGTTPVQIDFTAPETKIAFDAPLVAVRLTPDTEPTGTGVTGIQLSVDQYR